jgi:hypothetical protein
MTVPYGGGTFGAPPSFCDDGPDNDEEGDTTPSTLDIKTPIWKRIIFIMLIIIGFLPGLFLVICTLLALCGNFCR